MTNTIPQDVIDDAKSAGITNSNETILKVLHQFAIARDARQDKLIAEYERLKKDAERYRKLKELALTPQTFKSFAISKFDGMHWDSYEGGIMDLDQALDKAKKG